MNKDFDVGFKCLTTIKRTQLSVFLQKEIIFRGSHLFVHPSFLSPIISYWRHQSASTGFVLNDNLTGAMLLQKNRWCHRTEWKLTPMIHGLKFTTFRRELFMNDPDLWEHFSREAGVKAQPCKKLDFSVPCRGLVFLSHLFQEFKLPEK